MEVWIKPPFMIIVPYNVPSKVRNSRKMRNCGQNFSTFANCYNNLKIKLAEIAQVFLCKMKAL